MVRVCSVQGCRRKPATHPGTRLYTFPKNEYYKKIWVDFCKSENPISSSGAICNVHFEDKYRRESETYRRYGIPSKRCRDLLETAIPTLNGPNTATQESLEEIRSSTQEQLGNDNLNGDFNTATASNQSYGCEGPAGDTTTLPTPTTSQRLAQHLEGVIQENERVISSTLTSPETESDGRSERLLLVREENKTLLQLNKELKMEGAVLKSRCKELETESGEWKRKFKESQIESRELRKKLNALEKTNVEMSKELNNLKRELENEKGKNEKYEAILSKYFTVGQLKRLKTDKKNRRLRWCAEDIASAISLRCVSIKAYWYMKYKLGHPLPHIRTLRRWAQKVTVQEGEIDIVLELMRHKAKTMKELEKLTVLAFDEMSLDSLYCYCRQTDTVYSEVEKVQVVMARGLFSNWKQPVAFYYDTDMTKDLLYSIIKRLDDADFEVVGFCSDLGGENRFFQKQLGLSSFFTSFAHPCDPSKKIFCFADAPHLIKLFRNHFLDHGYWFKETERRKDIIEKILEKNQSELNIKHRLSQIRHLDVHGNARQRVGPAVELMSSKTADLIDHCCEHGHITVRNHQVASEVFRAIGDFFSIFNNMSYKNKLWDKQAYGLSLKAQDEKLDEIVRVVGKMRKIHKLKNGENTDAMLPFQHGVLMSIKSLREMLPYLQRRYPDITHILTKRLNQDCLENFFGYMRGMSDRYDHPSPVVFKYRIKLYILGKHHSTVFVVNKNTSEIIDEECLITPSKSFAPHPTSTPKCMKVPPATCQDTEEDLLPLPGLETFDDLFMPDDDDDLLVIDLGRVEDEEPVERSQDEETEGKDTEGLVEVDREDLAEGEKDDQEEKSEKEDQRAIDEIWDILHKEAVTAEEKIEKEGFKYVAGYVAHKYRTKYTYLGMKTKESGSKKKAAKDKTWLEVVSKGNMIKPSEEFKSVLECVEAVFLNVHGKDKGHMKRGKEAVAGVLKQAQKYLQENSKKKNLVHIPEEVIKCYIRVRTFFRIRSCTERVKTENIAKANAKKFNNKNNKLTGNKNKIAKKKGAECKETNAESIGEEVDRTDAKKNPAGRKRKSANETDAVAPQRRRKQNGLAAENVESFNELSKSAKVKRSKK